MRDKKGGNREIRKKIKLESFSQAVGHMKSHTQCGPAVDKERWRDMVLITRERSLCNVVLKQRETAISKFFKKSPSL